MSGEKVSVAQYYGIPEEVAKMMSNEMDAEAETYHKYPGKAWQLCFEMDWLRERGYDDAADKAASDMDKP